VTEANAEHPEKVYNFLIPSSMVIVFILSGNLMFSMAATLEWICTARFDAPQPSKGLAS
jgi:hypothetical protein